MSDPTLNTLLKEYEKKKLNADINFEKSRDAFYNSDTELSELNSKLNHTALEISKAILNDNLTLADKLKSDFNKLSIYFPSH